MMSKYPFGGDFGRVFSFLSCSFSRSLSLSLSLSRSRSLSLSGPSFVSSVLFSPPTSQKRK